MGSVKYDLCLNSLTHVTVDTSSHFKEHPDKSCHQKWRINCELKVQCQFRCIKKLKKRLDALHCR